MWKPSASKGSFTQGKWKWRRLLQAYYTEQYTQSAQRATKGRSNKEEVMTSTPRSEGWQSSRPLNCCRTREKSSLPLLPIDLSPVDYKVRSAAERYRRGDWRHSQLPRSPCPHGTRPTAKGKDFVGKVGGSLCHHGTRRWQLKSRRKTHKWMARPCDKSARLPKSNTQTIMNSWANLIAFASPAKRKQQGKFPMKKDFQKLDLIDLPINKFGDGGESRQSTWISHSLGRNNGRIKWNL